MAIDPQTKPHSLTHISNLSWDDDNQLIVHEIVGVDANGVVRKVPVTADGALSVTTNATLPTSGNNPSATYTEVWVGNVKTTTIQKVIGATTYQKVYVENKTTGVTTETAWTEV